MNIGTKEKNRNLLKERFEGEELRKREGSVKEKEISVRKRRPRYVGGKRIEQR